MLKTRVAAVLLALLFAIGAVAEETTRLGTRYQAVHGWPELPPVEILGSARAEVHRAFTFPGTNKCINRPS